MEYKFTDEEIRKAKTVMERMLDYKVSDIQRAILKGYTYSAKLIDFIKGS